MRRREHAPLLAAESADATFDSTEIFGNNQEKENKKISRIEKTIDGLDEKDKTTSINDEIAESEQRAKEKDAHFDKIASKHTVKEIISAGLKSGIEAAKGKSIDEIIADYEEYKRTGKIDRPTPESKKVRWTEDQPKDCGSCPVATKGDKSAIKCNPCTYLGRAEA